MKKDPLKRIKKLGYLREKTFQTVFQPRPNIKYAKNSRGRIRTIQLEMRKNNA